MPEHQPSPLKSFCFAGGGTGGHLIPGMNVARELLSRDGQTGITFVGSERPQEQELVAAAGFAHRVLPSEPLPSLRRRPWRFAWRNWRAYWGARGLLRLQTPDVVIGLGGFASVPTVLAARRLGIPVVLLEQNLMPGRATRWLAKNAQTVCISFAGSEDYLPRRDNLALTGNPVHTDIAGLIATSHVDVRRTLLVLGGSQGASAVNRAMTSVVELLADRLTDWTIVHQTGIEDWHDIEHHYQKLGLNYVTAPFFSDMPQRYESAGLVVSRAGATSLAELACAGCPTIAIPYPSAADDHQLLNARFFEVAGAARIVEQQTDPAETVRRLTKELSELITDGDSRARMQKAMHALAHPRATQQVADVVLGHAGPTVAH